MSERIELTTERLLLRPFRLEDVDDAFAVASDSEWARYLPDVPQPYTRRDAEEFVARQLMRSWNTNPGWAIVIEGRVIGTITIQVDGRHEIAELAYAISRDHWGRGLMTESARAVTEWAFSERGFAKVWANTDAGNSRSVRVMEKLGMTREGVLRSHRLVRGERRDEVCYGLLHE